MSDTSDDELFEQSISTGTGQNQNNQDNENQINIYQNELESSNSGAGRIAREDMLDLYFEASNLSASTLTDAELSIEAEVGSSVGVMSSTGERDNDGDEDVTDEEERIQFDIQLPYQHLYLGSNLQPLPGYSYLEERSVHSLPLLSSTKIVGLTVLIPGQTIPLNFVGNSRSERIKKCLEENIKVFGIILQKGLDQYPISKTKDMVGVTIDIFEFGTTNESSGEHGEFCCKARVTQRFKLLDIPKIKTVAETSWLVGCVYILPEILLSDPLKTSGSVQMSLNKLRTSSYVNCDRREATLTPWPCLVYKNYQWKNLVENIHKSLAALLNDAKCRFSKTISNKQNPMHFPSDPIQLSYWILINIPMSDSKRVEILQLDNIILRLKRLQDYFELFKQYLRCIGCFQLIAKMKDLFFMSASGPQGTYVNPTGYIHETITLLDVQNVNMENIYTVNYSWFPGYAWSIAHCRRCKTHVGWRFAAAKPGLIPKYFYGITKRSIMLAVGYNNGESTENSNVYEYRARREFTNDEETYQMVFPL